MWLVMEHEIINLNQVSSISIVRGGVDEGKEWHGVCLRYVARAPSYKFDESDLRLFEGTLEECKVFLREFGKWNGVSGANEHVELDFIIQQANIR